MATSFSGGRSRSTRREQPTIGTHVLTIYTGIRSSLQIYVYKRTYHYKKFDKYNNRVVLVVQCEN
jgi:hypothetical protein